MKKLKKKKRKKRISISYYNKLKIMNWVSLILKFIFQKNKTKIGFNYILG